MKSEFWKQLVIAGLASILNAPMGVNEMMKDPKVALMTRLQVLQEIANYLDEREKEGIPGKI